MKIARAQGFLRVATAATQVRIDTRSPQRRLFDWGNRSAGCAREGSPANGQRGAGEPMRQDQRAHHYGMIFTT
jgi:hypothetical protein